ncbi:MAG: methyltransferase [Rhodospirillales bacterium]
MEFRETTGDRASTLLGGRLAFRQAATGYRSAIDPIVLAAATAPPVAAQVFDLGCGAGALSLCLLRRRGDLSVVGLDLDGQSVALARRNARDNGLRDRFQVISGDAADLPEALRQRSFDWAVSNPPFYRSGAGGRSADRAKTRAHQEDGLDLRAWIAVLLRRLRPGGGLTLVHRADRLPDLLAGLEGRAGAVRILPLWPKQGLPAKRVLVQARKGSRAPAALLPGLILHGSDGGYSAAAEAILRHGAALPME